MKNFSFIDNIMENPTIKKLVKPVNKLFNKNKKKKETKKKRIRKTIWIYIK